MLELSTSQVFSGKQGKKSQRVILALKLVVTQAGDHEEMTKNTNGPWKKISC